MTNMSRLTISLTPEIEEKVLELRRTDRFCRCSLSEIIRALIVAGISSDHADSQIDSPTPDRRAG